MKQLQLLIIHLKNIFKSGELDEDSVTEKNSATAADGAIAHRLTTLKNCDRIIVLNKGKIEEDGKFDDLIEKNGMFSDMYYGKLN